MELIQEVLLVTQLRDVLSARDSPKPTQEHEQYGLAGVRPQSNTVFFKVQQVKVKDIVHYSPLLVVGKASHVKRNRYSTNRDCLSMTC